MPARTPILLQHEAGPFNAGVNIAQLPSDIQDNQCAVIQDMFLDQPGLIYSRGTVEQTVTPATAVYSASNKRIRGMFSTAAPDGKSHMAVISQDTVGAFGLELGILADNGGSLLTSYSLDTAWPITSDTEVDAKPALGGGVWIGVNGKPTVASIANRQLLCHWRGATTAQYTTGTMTSVLGSTTVTGVGTTWTNNVTPGMFLSVTHNQLIGVVRSVTDNLHLVLEAPASWAFAGVGYALDAVRGFGLEVSKGRIKVGATTTTVIGSGTKFQASGLDTTWTLFRAKDNAVIGTVSSISTVNPDEGLTLAAPTTLTMDNEPYTARQNPLSNPTNQFLLPPTFGVAQGFVPGTLNCTYAAVQWFARQDAPTVVGTGDMHSRVWFSDFRNMNSVDMVTTDGDFIQVPSTVGPNLPIRAIAATAHSLLVFKENETFAITGSDASDFSLQKIWDDGCIAMQSVIQYKGTVIWAGRNGIYIWDGVSVTDLVTNTLGNAWVAFVRNFDVRTHTMRAATYQDHYLLTINTNGLDPGTSATIPLYTTCKNQGTVNKAIQPTISIFIPDRAVSFLTQPILWGSAKLNQKFFYAAGVPAEVGGVRVCDFDELFRAPTVTDNPDNNVQILNSFTPDPYIETKRYSMGDPLRLKIFRQVMCTLDNSSNFFKVEIAQGLKDSSIAATFILLAQTFANTAGVVTTNRVKFLNRDRHFALKFYVSNQAGQTPFAWFKFRRLAIGYKWQKVGRI